MAGAALLEGAEEKEKPGGEKEEDKVSPPEDLMREHGVLKRILLIYGEAIRRMSVNQELPVEVVLDSAKMIRSFVEDYHEKLEEDYLFPRFEKAGKLVDLTKILRTQHQAGRRVTDLTISLAKQSVLKNAGERAVSPNRSSSSFACTIRTKRARIRCSFRLFAASSVKTNLIR